MGLQKGTSTAKIEEGVYGSIDYTWSHHGFIESSWIHLGETRNPWESRQNHKSSGIEAKPEILGNRGETGNRDEIFRLRRRPFVREENFQISPRLRNDAETSGDAEDRFFGEISPEIGPKNKWSERALIFTCSCPLRCKEIAYREIVRHSAVRLNRVRIS